MNLFSHGKVVSVLQYFTDKIDDYWHIVYPLTNSREMEKDPYLYYYDISRKATDYSGEFSPDGLYMFYGYDGKYHIYALELAQYTLACWLAWRKNGDKIWLDKAMLHSDWLVGNQKEDGSWRMEHKNQKYSSMPDSWSSALAQGLAVSALVRAYRYTDDKSYLIAAQKAVDFLEVDVKKGGVKRSFWIEGEEYFIYEEYPTSTLNGVLNGHISALLGLKDFDEVVGKESELYRKNIENLIDLLPHYDIGYWSLYSLDGNISSGFYHRLVVRQLKALTGLDVRFSYWHHRFNSYLENKFYALAALTKKIAGRFS